MAKIKKGDTVTVLSGKDKGKTGKVLKVFPADRKCVVESVNFIKKAVRRTRDDQQGGVVQMEGEIDVSNVAINCKTCKKPVRVSFSRLADGSKSRFCKACHEMI